MNKAEVIRLFENRKMGIDALAKRNALETAAQGLAVAIYNMVPDSRERSLAFTKLEEAIMWANKGLSRHGE